MKFIIFARPTSRKFQREVCHRLGEKIDDGNRDFRAINIETVTEIIEKEGKERKKQGPRIYRRTAFTAMT